MIPKIIHYVWIGDRPKSELTQKCIASWKEFCPDFEIKEWDNSSLSAIKMNCYVSQAIECKKWAFVSDYIRLYALYSYGGFYLDTDCEITAPIDIFLNYSHVLGFETYGSDSPQKIASSFWGCEKNNIDIKNIMDQYDKLCFIKDNRKMDLTANVHRISTYFQQKYRIEPPYKADTEYYFGDNGIILPTYYFCKPLRGKTNFAIHHFAYSCGYSGAAEPPVRKMRATNPA